MYGVKGIAKNEFCPGPNRPPSVSDGTLPSAVWLPTLANADDAPMVTSYASRPLGTAGRAGACLHRGPP